MHCGKIVASAVTVIIMKSSNEASKCRLILQICSLPAMVFEILNFQMWTRIDKQGVSKMPIFEHLHGQKVLNKFWTACTTADLLVLLK